MHGKYFYFVNMPLTMKCVAMEFNVKWNFFSPKMKFNSMEILTFFFLFQNLIPSAQCTPTTVWLRGSSLNSSSNGLLKYTLWHCLTLLDVGRYIEKYVYEVRVFKLNVSFSFAHTYTALGTEYTELMTFYRQSSSSTHTRTCQWKHQYTACDRFTIYIYTIQNDWNHKLQTI